MGRPGRPPKVREAIPVREEEVPMELLPPEPMLEMVAESTPETKLERVKKAFRVMNTTPVFVSLASATTWIRPGKIIVDFPDSEYVQRLELFGIELKEV